MQVIRILISLVQQRLNLYLSELLLRPIHTCKRRPRVQLKTLGSTWIRTPKTSPIRWQSWVRVICLKIYCLPYPINLYVQGSLAVVAWVSLGLEHCETHKSLCLTNKRKRSNPVTAKHLEPHKPILDGKHNWLALQVLLPAQICHVSYKVLASTETWAKLLGSWHQPKCKTLPT